MAAGLAAEQEEDVDDTALDACHTALRGGCRCGLTCDDDDDSLAKALRHSGMEATVVADVSARAEVLVDLSPASRHSVKLEVRVVFGVRCGAACGGGDTGGCCREPIAVPGTSRPGAWNKDGDRNDTEG